MKTKSFSEKFQNVKNNVLEIFGLFLLLIAIAILYVLFLLDMVYKFFFPKRWEARELRRDREYKEYMRESTKDRGWAFQDLS